MRPVKVELGNVDFRKKASLRAKDIIAIKEQIRDFLERYLEVEEILGITHRFQKPQPLPLGQSPMPVSYTHLDVYKRQVFYPGFFTSTGRIQLSGGQITVF